MTEFLQGGGWAAFSVGAAVFSAAFFLVNQYFRLPGHMVVFWMRVITVLLMTPYMAHVPLPQDPLFYLIMLVTVVCGTGADIRAFNVSAKYGGGVVSRVQPLIVWGSFFLWFFFDPAIIRRYIDHPYNTAGILLALFGCVWFATRLNRCRITRAAFIDMLPALAGYTVTTVLNKYAMHMAPLESAVFGYMYIQSVFAVVMIGGYAAWREREAVLPPSWRLGTMMAAAGLASLAWIGHMVQKNYAMAFTPNPSYQAALNLTTPVFIALFYLAVGHKEEADVRSGFGIVACALLLAFLTVR